MTDPPHFKNIEKLSEFLEQEENLENESLEFKENINHINRSDIKDFIDIYFDINIVKAIYAMANTKGGRVLVGISNDKKIIGIKEKEAEYLKKIIKDISVIESRTEELKLENGKIVLNIIVEKVNTYQKAIKKGVIYYREKDSSQHVRTSKDLEKLYAKEQFYSFYSEGIRENLRVIENDKKTEFDINNYITGLQKHIENSHILKSNVENLLKISNEIKKELIIKKKETPFPKEEPKKSIGGLIENFIKTYKESIK